MFPATRVIHGVFWQKRTYFDLFWFLDFSMCLPWVIGLWQLIHWLNYGSILMEFRQVRSDDPKSKPSDFIHWIRMTKHFPFGHPFPWISMVRISQLVCFFWLANLCTHKYKIYIRTYIYIIDIDQQPKGSQCWTFGYMILTV